MEKFEIVQDDRESKPKVMVVKVPYKKNQYDAEKFVIKILGKEGISAKVAREYSTPQIQQQVYAVRWEEDKIKGESIIKLRNLITRVIREESISNSLEKDIRFWYKQNKQEIDKFIQNDDWETVYEILQDNFPDQDSDKLNTIFNKIVD